MGIKIDLKNSEYIVSPTSQSSLVLKMHCFALKRGLFGAVSITIEVGFFTGKEMRKNLPRRSTESHKKLEVIINQKATKQNIHDWGFTLTLINNI